MRFLQRLMSKHDRREPDKLRQAYRSIFNSGAGNLVLEDLCAVLKQVRGPDRTGESAVDARAFMDGQKSVALRVLAMIED